MTAWDAGQYMKFSGERTQPSIDLAAKVAVLKPERIVDLGCGPGNSTEVLRSRWPGAEIVGLDSSEEMISAASRSFSEGKWVLADIASWESPVLFDVVFSNAALQWVPNHESLIPRLFALVASGGALAVQLPSHFKSAMHREILEVADDPAWRHLMDKAKTAMTKKPLSFYYDVLRPLASRLDLWETEYYHAVEGPESVLAWFRGTGLRPFLSALGSEEQKSRFEEKLLERYGRIFPRQADGRVLFPFRRLFFIAYRA
ncbi:MAG: methyltransferase domain-containing protein [Desulfobacteraceae bacterium]|nr:methyltransferase domain-containing protein [Desulfobacteraceae bacterium]